MFVADEEFSLCYMLIIVTKNAKCDEGTLMFGIKLIIDFHIILDLS